MNVLVIKNRLISTQQVLNDFKNEGYTHKFIFGDDLGSRELEYFDEIWTYGDVRSDRLFKKVLNRGLNYWVMY